MAGPARAERGEVLVLIPARDEETSVGRVVRGALALPFPARVLVVDDGSTDGTARAAREAGAHHVVSLPVNLGIGGAVQTGLLFALRRGFTRVARLDGDGQHDPACLPALLAALGDGGAGLAIGSRFLGGEGFRSLPLRRGGIAALSGLVLLLSGTRVRDITSGCRAWSREAVEAIAPDYPVDYPEPDETLALLLRGVKVAEVPVEMRERRDGASSIRGLLPLFYMVKVSLSLLMTWWRERRVGPHA